MSRHCLLLLFGLLPALGAGGTLRGAEDPSGLEFFEKKVRPVLVQHCHACHSSTAKKLRGGLRLDSRAALLTGGDSGPAIVPGQPDRSRLIEAIGYQSVELQMPPRARLPDAVIADLTAWVRMGAPWPQQKAETTSVTGKPVFDLAQRKREHWAWQIIRPPLLPTVRDAHWPRDPVDRFLLARLEEEALTPAPAADRRTLLRRLFFDLIGLPPSPAEIEDFIHDSSPLAYEKVVDRLLAAPQFGERWARHWLDLVRYGETRGHEFDYPIPNAYQYRDYVIRALNADLPYDQFVTEHLAGDLLPRPRRHPVEGFNESILATGFWFLGEEVHSPVDIRQDQAERLDNKVDVFSKTFLGLTVACARCHDHKFDAISTRDYYSLYGFLESSSYRLVRFDTQEQHRRIAAQLAELRERSRAPLQKALADAFRPGVERMADYLLAARSSPAGKTDRQRLEKVARDRRLDPTVLERWQKHLSTAAEDKQDPLHLWGGLAASSDAKVVKRLAESVHQSVDEIRNPTDLVPIVDYRRHQPGAWLPDGFAFGLGPVGPGELRVREEADQPIVRFTEQAAAEKDPTWDVLAVAPGAENDPGALGRVMRAGRTLRTPTFPITTGKIFYFVKGTGFAYASVGGHIMIAGPLHSRVVQPINTGDRFQWLAHDLSPYAGQRAHLEFTATGSADFAVACVAQGTTLPRWVEPPNCVLGEALTEAAEGSLESLAASYQHLFLQTLDRLAADQVRVESAADHARLANWLVRHAGLFMAPGNPATERWREAVRSFLDRQAQLVSEIRRESRLAVALLDGSGEDEHVFIRGSPKAPGELVPRRFLEALAGPAPLAIGQGSGRLELARQMTDPLRDPFLPRVLVNRVWHHLFGRGIVASTDNFGVLGDRPTHPDLLDHLADRFVREGWSIKKLIRALVLSSAYRMSSRPGGPGDEVDPDNLLLHRMRMRRLEGETIRDAMLAVSGRLNDRLYGPSVLVHLTAFQEGRGRPQSGPLDGDGRRSLYLAVRRNFLSAFLLAFDTPSPFSTVGRRTVSNVPAQSLLLLNDPFVSQQAQRWAQRVLAEPGSARARIAGMYQSAFGRAPTESELCNCLAFLDRQAALAMKRPDDPAVWADLAHVLFNVKEFIFLN
jgi:hypothetical protein